MKTFRQVERHRHIEDNVLTNLRMAVSAFGEAYYFTKNFIDHAVGFSEQMVLGKEYLPERLKEYRGQKTVAFLYHGYLQGRSAFAKMERILQSRLFDIFAVSGGYQPFCQDLRVSAEYEREAVDYVLSEVDAEQVFMIGHSQGGLIIRHMLQKLDGAGLADKVVTLSTPHQGTWAALGGAVTRAVTFPFSLLPGTRSVVGESGFQMLPGSRFLRELNDEPLPAGVDFTSIFSYIDPLVWPPSYAICPYPEAYNILMKKVGHFQTIYDIQAYEVMLRALLLPRREGFKNLVREFAGKVIEEKRYLRNDAVIDEVVICSD